MTIANKLLRMKEDLDNVYEAGKAAGGGGGGDYYDEFWDAFQQNGNRQSYLNGFSGHGWTDETFKPKYSMTPTRAGSMFIYCHIFDLKGALERQGVTLDTSQATSVSSMFTECWIQYVPTISTVSCTACTNLFSNNSYVKSVECLVVREEGGQTFNNAFLNCPALEEIRISGKFATNISFAQSTKLSKASIQSIYSALIIAGDASQYTLTLSLTAVNKAFETSAGANDGSTSTEWQDLTTSTPWRTVLS